MLDGETAFRQQHNYGFPLDLTADVCRERGVTVDEAGFEAPLKRPAARVLALYHDGKPASSTVTPRSRQTSAVRSSGKP